MDLRQLEYFVVLAEELHFGLAAERLHMAQPPLSVQIKKLEKELGVELFHRTTRAVSLTEAGEFPLPRAQRLLLEAEELKIQVRIFAQGYTRLCRIGFVGAATYRLMPEVIRLSRTRLPHVHLHVQGEMLTPQIEAALNQRDLDVALMRPPLMSPMIEHRVLRHDRLLLALPAEHPLAGVPGGLTLADLRDEVFVCYPPNSAVSEVLRPAFTAAGFTPRTIMEATETSSLLSLVGAGLGVALVPETARPETPGAVAYRDVSGLPTIELAVCWRRNSGLDYLPDLLAVIEEAAGPAASGGP